MFPVLLFVVYFLLRPLARCRSGRFDDYYYYYYYYIVIILTTMLILIVVVVVLLLLLLLLTIVINNTFDRLGASVSRSEASGWYSILNDEL